MNKVTFSTDSPKRRAKTGDFYTTEGGGEVFILANTSEGFVAVGLQDGNSWHFPHKTAEEAVMGLTFLGRGLKVELSH